MAGVISAGTLFAIGGAIVGGMALSQMMQPKAPQIPTPEKPPQPNKAPKRATALQNNATAALPGGAMAGNSGTFLTGATGIDPSTLNLGKNTLLGQ